MPAGRAFRSAGATGGWSAGSTSPWRGPAGCATRLMRFPSDAGGLQAFGGADAEQAEADSKADPRGRRQPQPFAADLSYVSEAGGAHGVNCSRSQPLQVPGELVGPTAARRRRHPFGEPGQRVEQRQLPRFGEQARPELLGVGWPGPQRGGPAQHRGRGGVRITNSIGGIAQHVPRDDRRLRRVPARRRSGQREAHRVRARVGDRSGHGFRLRRAGREGLGGGVGGGGGGGGGQGGGGWGGGGDTTARSG